MLALSIIMAAGAVGQPPCDAAREHYESLAFDDALAAIERATARSATCFEVEALVLMALDRRSEAEAVLRTLFEDWPEHAVDVRALAPPDRALIERVRAISRPLAVEVSAGWLLHTALLLEFRVQGGLRGAKRLRYRGAVVDEEGTEVVRLQDAVSLTERSASVTVQIPREAAANALHLRVGALDAVGRTLHAVDLERPLGARPAERQPGRAEVSETSVPWWVWAIGGAVLVGAAVTTVVLVQPDDPDASGTAGRIRVP